MKKVQYHWFIGEHRPFTSEDTERAVLPTIIFARDQAGPASGIAVSVGWWKWGIGIIRIVTKDTGDR